MRRSSSSPQLHPVRLVGQRDGQGHNSVELRPLSLNISAQLSTILTHTDRQRSFQAAMSDNSDHSEIEQSRVEINLNIQADSQMDVEHRRTQIFPQSPITIVLVSESQPQGHHESRTDDSWLDGSIASRSLQNIDRHRQSPVNIVRSAISKAAIAEPVSSNTHQKVASLNSEPYFKSNSKQNFQRKKEELDMPKAQCPVCLGNIKAQDMMEFSTNCAHLVCRPCLKGYIKSQIQSNEFIKCLHDECQQILHFGAPLMKLLTSQQQRRYYQILVAKSLSGNNTDIKPCPTPNCTEGFLTTAERFSMCYLCQREYCVRCMAPKHRGKCDKAVVKNMVRNMEFMVCSKCKRVVERRSGCLHMRCICKYQFCYKCGRNWKDPNFKHQSYNECHFPLQQGLLESSISQIERQKIESKLKVQVQPQPPSQASRLSLNEQPPINPVNPFHVQRHYNPQQRHTVLWRRLPNPNMISGVYSSLQELQNISSIEEQRNVDVVHRAQQADHNLAMFMMHRRIVRDENVSRSRNESQAVRQASCCEQVLKKVLSLLLIILMPLTLVVDLVMTLGLLWFTCIVCMLSSLFYYNWVNLYRRTQQKQLDVIFSILYILVWAIPNVPYAAVVERGWPITHLSQCVRSFLTRGGCLTVTLCNQMP